MSHEMMTEGGTARPRVSATLALLFSSVAVLLLGLATLGVFNPLGHVVVSVLFDHPFLFGVPVLAVLGVACWVGPGPVAMRATALFLSPPSRRLGMRALAP